MMNHAGDYDRSDWDLHTVRADSSATVPTRSAAWHCKRTYRYLGMSAWSALAQAWPSGSAATRNDFLTIPSVELLNPTEPNRQSGIMTFKSRGVTSMRCSNDSLKIRSCARVETGAYDSLCISTHRTW